MAAEQPQPGSRLDLSKEYWSMRMEEDERIDHFRRRVYKVEKSLDYDLEPQSPKKQPFVDLWLARLQPRMIERLKKETGQQLEFETVGDVFDTARKIEFDDRVRRAKRYGALRVRPGETFGDFQARISFFEETLQYVMPEPNWIPENRIVDQWIVRIGSEHRERLRRHTNSLKNISTEKEFLAALRELDEIEAQKKETQGDEIGDQPGPREDNGEVDAGALERGELKKEDGDRQAHGYELLMEEDHAENQEQAQDGEAMEDTKPELTAEDSHETAHEPRPLYTALPPIQNRPRRQKTPYRRERDRQKNREWRQRKKQRRTLEQVAAGLHNHFAEANNILGHAPKYPFPSF
ncbi:uncharacterized protein J3D65DRAFT_670677 [Phyllosticta citribraziliensis]|uniref:Uncharacterized protein n=1 Tax=Phyllosticta citribraziliensis TaxID=989973 RepID=A0ABR1L9V8_9PEZI